MNTLKSFEHERFGRIRLIDRDGGPWFVLGDLCDTLDTRTNDAMNSLDDDEKGYEIIVSPGGNQEMAIVSEAGFYSLILRSRKPEAREFKRWVTHEVLPSIRKHGAYMTDSLVDKVMKDPAIIYAMAETILTERGRREAAEEKLRYLKPDVPFGTISETTGRPRTRLVGPYWKSPMSITVTINPVVEWQRSLFD